MAAAAAAGLGYISPDSQAIILLCSSLAISRKGEKDEDEKIPFTLPEWNVIARKLSSSVLKSPGAFFQADAEQWQKYLGLSTCGWILPAGDSRTGG